MTTNEATVYVVSNGWWRDGSTVIGVADSVLGAQEVADRHEVAKDDSRFTGWADWKEREGGKELYRDALAGSEIHPSLYQEIVAVPMTTVARRPVEIHHDSPPPTVNTALRQEAWEIGRGYSGLR